MGKKWVILFAGHFDLHPDLIRLPKTYGIYTSQIRGVAPTTFIEIQ
jgi:hypothetical protein